MHETNKTTTKNYPGYPWGPCLERDSYTLDGNPLVELSSLENPTCVFVKGRKLNRETLDSYKEKAKNRKNVIASALRYLENLIIEK